MDEVDEVLIAEGIAIDLNKIKGQWSAKVREILTEATLSIPDENMWMQEGGKQGSHSEHLGFLLAEMQSMQRTYPNMEW
jgi:ring-1,2-phenylacetyl-CoA epoxidase subunit PaaC